MNELRFDTLTRARTDGPLARRAFARWLAGAVIAAGLARWSAEDLQARKRRKRKKRKKPLENEFGCRNVGVACTNASQCCSGICEGNRRKNGKKPKKTCRAHDTGDCRIQDDSCRLNADSPCVTTAGEEGFCHATTGNAPFCAAEDGITFDCTKDEECIPFCGPRAACLDCAIPGGAEIRFCGGPSGCVAP